MLVIWAAASDAPTGDGTLREGLERDQVSPGLLGFLLTFFIVILTFFLIRDMARRIRRVRYREQVVERAAAMNDDGTTAHGTDGSAPIESAVDGGANARGSDGDAPSSRRFGTGGNPPEGRHGPHSETDEQRRD